MPKKILLLITQDHGGAGEYIYKLAKILFEQGHQVAMVVKEKTKTDEFIVQYDIVKQKEPFFLKIINKLNKKKRKIKLDAKYCFYSLDELNPSIDPDILIKKIGFVPEFIFSGWTAFFMNSADVLSLHKKTGAKVFTFLVDMNHLTGGCHYAWDCEGYVRGCSECPAILSEKHKDRAKINFEAKFKNAHEGNFKIISGSGWTLKQAKESKIYRDQDKFLNINSLIDTKVMTLTDKSMAKDFFNLDHDKFYILMGSQYGNDPRKGYKYLLESLKILHAELGEDQRSKINIIIVSSGKTKSFEEIPFEKTHLDYIKDYKKLSLLYQSIDVFVNSSVEDSGPMMVSEALACGTPTVGFDMGIVNNMVITGYNGYKAKLKDAEDLSKGIKMIFELSPSEYQRFSENATNQIREFSSLEFGAAVINEILTE